jgi:hypothetical protein
MGDIQVLADLLAELREIKRANDPEMMCGSFLDALRRRKVDQLDDLARCFLHAELPNLASMCHEIANQKRLAH